MVGLQYLFLEPNADDPLNKGKLMDRLPCCRVLNTILIEAATEMSKNRDTFLQHVKQSMRGVNIKGIQYDNVTAR